MKKILLLALVIIVIIGCTQEEVKEADCFALPKTNLMPTTSLDVAFKVNWSSIPFNKEYDDLCSIKVSRGIEYSAFYDTEADNRENNNVVFYELGTPGSDTLIPLREEIQKGNSLFKHKNKGHFKWKPFTYNGNGYIDVLEGYVVGCERLGIEEEEGAIRLPNASWADDGNTIVINQKEYIIKCQ